MASIAKTALSVTDVIMQVASFSEKALPVAELIAGLIPGAGVVVSAIKVAAPIIAKIDKYGPLVRKAVEAGAPITDAIQQHGPDLVGAIKDLYAIAVNHDPERPETGLTGGDIETNVALYSYAGELTLFGQRWTNDEYERWWARAQGGV